MLSSSGVSSPKPELSLPHYNGYDGLRTPKVSLCLPQGNGVGGKNAICFSSYQQMLSHRPFRDSSPSKKVLSTRSHFYEAWTESQRGISLHHYNYGTYGSERNVMARKENTYMPHQKLTSLLPSPPVEQKWVCTWRSYDMPMNAKRSKVKMQSYRSSLKDSVLHFPSWLNTQVLWPRVHKVEMVCLGVSLNCY